MRFAFIDPGHPVNFVRANLNVADGQWQYLAGVRDAVTRELRLYIDGRQEAMAADLTTVSTGNSADFEIGRSETRGYIRGIIDDVGLWRSALTAEEVRRHMYWRLNGTEFGLAAYWPLDEGSGGIAADATGRGHNGSLQGSPTWVLSTVPAGQSVVDEEIVTGAGEVTFSGTGVSMNFAAISGTDTFMGLPS